MSKTPISRQQKYIQHTLELNEKRSSLEAELNNKDVKIEHLEHISKELESVYRVLAVNAVVLAKMLAEHLEDN